MVWSWNKLAAAKWEDAWNERIAGNPNAVITQIKGGKTIRITVYCDCETDAQTLKDYFGGTIRMIKTQDWGANQAKIKRPPLRIRDSLLISDQIEPKTLATLHKAYPKRVILSIPPEMAFGTGDHATTATCLRLICDFAKKKKGTAWTMTDIGCGTAVLAMAASKLGASFVTAFDFDSIAVEIARRNMERNGITPEHMDLFTGDVFNWSPSPERQSDLVVANLFSTILQKAFPHIIATLKPQGELVISGILATQWHETKVAGESHGLVFTQVITRGKWVTAKACMP